MGEEKYNDLSMVYVHDHVQDLLINKDANPMVTLHNKCYTPNGRSYHIKDDLSEEDKIVHASLCEHRYLLNKSTGESDTALLTPTKDKKLKCRICGAVVNPTMQPVKQVEEVCNSLKEAVNYAKYTFATINADKSIRNQLCELDSLLSTFLEVYTAALVESYKYDCEARKERNSPIVSADFMNNQILRDHGV